MSIGAFGENLPYSNYHDLNMDWIIKIAKDFLDQYTHLQEVIDNGETSLQELTDSGLAQLDEKATNLTNLLQSWYDEHSEDIANELADAIADINSSLNASLTYFYTQIDNKANETIQSIPADYTELANEVSNLAQLTNPVYSKMIYNVDRKMILKSDGTTASLDDYHYMISNDFITIDPTKTYIFNGIMKYANAVIVFYNNAGTKVGDAVISTAGTLVSPNTYKFDNYQLVIPNTAVKVKIAYYGDYSNSGGLYVLVEYTPYPKKLKMLMDNITIEQETIVSTITENAILRNGTLVVAGNNSFKVTDYIPCQFDDVFYLTARMIYNNDVVNFYHDDTFIGKLTSNDGFLTDGTYVFNSYAFSIPDGVNRIRVGYYQNTSEPYMLKKDSETNITANTSFSNKKWVCVGDSLTEENARTTKHYFDYVQDYTNIAVVNMGVSGCGYARGAENNIAFYQRITSCPTDADVVTIFGSFNDLGAGIPMGEYTDTATTTIAGCINTTITNLQTLIPLVNLGIVAPTPWATTQPADSGVAYNYVELLKKICEHRSIPFLDLWRHSGLRPWDADFRAVAYTRDEGSGTHPDENGHKLIAPKFEGFLESRLLH